MRKTCALLALPELFTAATPHITLPIEFESTSVTRQFTNYFRGTSTRIDNPHFNGINTCVNPQAVVGINSSMLKYENNFIKLTRGHTYSTKLFAITINSAFPAIDIAGV